MSTLPLYFPSDATLLNVMAMGLFEDRILMKQGKDWDPKLSSPVVVSTFMSEKKELTAISVMEFEIAAIVAGTLTRFQKDVIQQEIDNKTFSQDFRENIREIMNIYSRIFNQNGHEHILFQHVWLTPSLDSVTQDLVAMAPKKLNVLVDTENDSGSGNLTFYAVDPEKSKSIDIAQFTKY
jgi:hypothetical protein